MKSDRFETLIFREKKTISSDRTSYDAVVNSSLAENSRDQGTTILQDNELLEINVLEFAQCTSPQLHEQPCHIAAKLNLIHLCTKGKLSISRTRISLWQEKQHLFRAANKFFSMWRLQLNYVVFLLRPEHSFAFVVMMLLRVPTSAKILNYLKQKL